MLKQRSILLLCVEIGILVLLTPIFFLKVFRLIVPAGSNSGLPVAIFVLCILSIIAILKLLPLKNMYIKLFAAWLMTTLAAAAIWCLIVPHIIGGAF